MKKKSIILKGQQTTLKMMLVCLFLLANILIFANNIQVSNFKLSSQDVSAGTNNIANFYTVKFDLTWDNSWRTSTGPANWDAAWVFVKYRVTVANGGDGIWYHAWLDASGQTAPVGGTIDIGLLNPTSAFNITTNPGVGAFVYRSSDGNGTVNYTNCQVKWNYIANNANGGVTLTDLKPIDIQLFAIEMVYVPQGSFYIGSGGTGVAEFRAGNTASTPYQVTSENAIIVANTTGNLIYTPSGYGGDLGSPIPASFPKGYNAFYCMKYEPSQQEFFDFLNNLTSSQANTYTLSGSWTSPSGSHPNWIPPNPYRIVNSTNASNAYCFSRTEAFLDWSGLRPMTELEFEKACRGPLNPVPDEFAWGTASYVATTASSGSGISEVSTAPAGANLSMSYNYSAGAMRVGAYATSTSDRVQSGGTYYGIMEMSGNGFEIVVHIGSGTQRAYTGLHGDGLLAISTGYPNVSNWPPVTYGGGGSEMALRGGGAHPSSTINYFRVSDRNITTSVLNNSFPRHVGRGVRTAP